MRIALIDPSLFTWPYDCALARGLAEGSHDVLVFGKALPPSHAAGNDPLLRQHFYRAFAAPFWDHAPKAIVRAGKGMSHLGSMQRLVRALSAWRPDVIHFQWCPLPAIDKLFLPALRRLDRK